jgi:hypothetical protein
VNGLTGRAGMKTSNATNDNQCVNPAGTPAPAPKAGVYRGADMATAEHREYRETITEWVGLTGEPPPHHTTHMAEVQ